DAEPCGIANSNPINTCKMVVQNARPRFALFEDVQTSSAPLFALVKFEPQSVVCHLFRKCRHGKSKRAFGAPHTPRRSITVDQRSLTYRAFTDNSRGAKAPAAAKPSKQ